MEDLNESGRIAVDMTIMAVVLFVLVTIQSVVMISARDASQNIINANNNSFGSKIVAMETYNGPLPAASVFSVLSAEEADVVSISGMVAGERIDSIKDLSKVFQYKVYVTVSPTEVDTYNITVRGESD